MKKLAWFVLALVGCEPAAPPAPVAPVPAAAGPNEPERVVVRHILVSFAGTRTKATRSKAEAEKLAQELFDRVKKGESFEELMRRYSDDTGPGEYGMANHGVAAAGPPREFPRGGMVAAFGNVGFKLAPNDVGLAPHHEKESPFGWHIIQRVK
jgi:parvulin-like peptidyl-prolyl isomerase